MSVKVRLLIGLLILLLCSPLSAAGIKCWINNSSGRDVKECGAHVPPEYALKKHTIMDSRGVVTSKDAAKTAEEIFIQQKAAKEKEIADRKQRAIDRVLTDTFANECDLIRSRDGKLIELDSHIVSTFKHIVKLQANRDQIEQQAASMERAGTAPSGDIKKKIDNVLNQIKQDEDFIANKRKSKKLLCEKFAADTRRFRELQKTTTPLMTTEECGFDLPEDADESVLDRCELQ